MELEEFNRLSDQAQKELLIDAKKITEREDDVAKYEVFQIDNFLVEVSRSVVHKFRKILRVSSLEDTPQ